MSSKSDYDKVIKKAAKRGRIVEVIAASINADPKSRAAALKIAKSEKINRQRAERRFAENAKGLARKKK